VFRWYCSHGPVLSGRSRKHLLS